MGWGIPRVLSRKNLLRFIFSLLCEYRIDEQISDVCWKDREDLMIRKCPCCGSMLFEVGKDETGIDRFICSNNKCAKSAWYSYHGWLSELRTKTLCSYLDRKVRIRTKDGEEYKTTVDNYESEIDSDEGCEAIDLFPEGTGLLETEIESIELIDTKLK